MPEPKYHWVMLDADDTILDFRRSAMHALEQTLLEHGLPAGATEQEIFHRINLEVWQAFERRQIDAVRLRNLRFERFLEAIGEYREPERLSRHYLHLLSQTDYMIPGAQDFLEALRQLGARLALITNGLKEVQRPRIATTGLSRWFEHFIISDEIGVAKPDRRFFDHAYTHIGRPEKEFVLVVGDSLHSDVQGGNDYGVDTCWFNPNGTANYSGIQPSFEASDYPQILERVNGNA